MDRELDGLKEATLERVTGIGGIFVRASHPQELQTWYQEKLGVPVSEEGFAMFEWREADSPEQLGQTTWSLFNQDTTYFDPSRSSWMINYRVETWTGCWNSFAKPG